MAPPPRRRAARDRCGELARPAHAWQEAHQTGDDVRVHVDPAGAGGGRAQASAGTSCGARSSRSISSASMPAAELEPDVTITAEDGTPSTAHATRHDEHTVRIAIDEPRALMRGNFTFDVRWRVDLVASHALSRDGATWRLAWSAPVATDGFDAATTVFELPAAPDAPVAIVADTGAVDDARRPVAASRARDATCSSSCARTSLAARRPCGRCGSTRARSPLVADPTLRPPSEAKAPAEPDRVREASLARASPRWRALRAARAPQGARVRRGVCGAGRAALARCCPSPTRLRATCLRASRSPAPSGSRSRGRATRGRVRAWPWRRSRRHCAHPPARSPSRGPGRWLVAGPRARLRGRLRRQPAAEIRPGCSRPPRRSAPWSVAAVVAARFDAEGPWLVVHRRASLCCRCIADRASLAVAPGRRPERRALARAGSFARLRRTRPFA